MDIMAAVVTTNEFRSDQLWPAPPSSAVRDFHRRMPSSARTPLIEAPGLAAELGIGHVLVKAEISRCGLPAFKILGASWATYRAICDLLGSDPEPWADLAEVRSRIDALLPLDLVTATDGNHGRAVARVASLLGLGAQILVPAGTAAPRIAAIEGEGARVEVVDGDYDDAVAQAAGLAGDRCLVISDTSWPGYETTPMRVAEGYSTIFDEIDEQVGEADLAVPDLVMVPVGVGALMAAAVSHHRQRPGGPILVGVEPLTANCVQASIEADALTSVPGPHPSIMAGLNCGTPSPVAWPRMRSGVDGFVAVDDDLARAAMCELADIGLAVGETGGAALAGLHTLCADPNGVLPHDTADLTALVLATEGPTDPENYQRIVGRTPDEVTGP
jgi:diaminopropionate ammonia-lyase